MTVRGFWTNTAQKRPNMAAILKFKMAAEGTLEKKGSNSGFVYYSIRKVKSISSTSIAKFCTELRILDGTPCTTLALRDDNCMLLAHMP